MEGRGEERWRQGVALFTPLPLRDLVQRSLAIPPQVSGWTPVEEEDKGEEGRRHWMTCMFINQGDRSLTALSGSYSARQLQLQMLTHE